MEEGDLSVGLSEHEDEGVEELPVLLEVEDQVVLVHEEGGDVRSGCSGRWDR